MYKTNQFSNSSGQNYAADERLYQSNQSNGSTSSRFQDLYEDAERKQKRKQQLLQEKQRQESDYIDPECTFQPKITQYQGASGTQIVQDKQLSIFDKNMQWQKEVQEKVNEKYKGSLDRDLDECTFHPQIDTDWKVKYDERPLQGNNTKGIPQFLKRQVLARQMKEQKELLLEYPYRKSQIQGNHQLSAILPSTFTPMNSQMQQSPQKMNGSPYEQSIGVTKGSFSDSKYNSLVASQQDSGSKRMAQAQDNSMIQVPVVKNTKHFQKAMSQLHYALHDIEI